MNKVEQGLPVKSDKEVIYSNIPVEIKDILVTTEGWLVGASASNLAQGTIPADYDIIVPSREKFQNAMLHLHGFDYGFNTYGGLKFQVDDMVVDIWCEELSHFLLNANRVGFVYNLKRNILLKSL